MVKVMRISLILAIPCSISSAIVIAVIGTCRNRQNNRKNGYK